MTWPFENDTSVIVKKLAKNSLKSEKRRNLMVVIAVALAASLICFSVVMALSILQMQRNRVVDTYEAVYSGITEEDTLTLKELPDFARVGEYYMLGEEHSGQGYNASYVYCDNEMMYIGRDQMKLLEGRLPEKEKEIVVSQYFLSTYGSSAEIGETVVLDTDSFQGEYIVTGIMDSLGEKEVNICAFVISKAALKEWSGYDPAGYRAYVHFENDRQLDEETMTAICKQIAKEYQLPVPGMNQNYFAYYKDTLDVSTLILVAGISALVLIGGYIVIQSIFRISISDKIQSYGQLRTIGATPKQISRIVKKEGRWLGSVGIVIGVLLGCGIGFVLFPRGFYVPFYIGAILLTVILGWFMVSVSIRRPVKIAAGISPMEAVRFVGGQSDTIRRHKKNIRLNPFSMGIANFRRDRKKTISIVASLSLSGVILLVASSILLTRSPEQYARQWFPDGDYKIYLDSEQSEDKVMAAGNPLNEELMQEVLSVDGVTDVIVKRQSVYAKFETSENSSAGMCDMLTDQNKKELEEALVAGTLPEDSRSVLLDTKSAEYFEDMRVGATIELSFGGETVPVTISGLFSRDAIISGHGIFALDSECMFAPEELFHELLPGIENFAYSWSIVSDPEQAESVEQSLEKIVSSHSNLGLDTIGVHIEYEKMQNTLAFGGIQALSWLIFMFGVVNLINTTLSNQISRKRENSILRSVGLTGKQLCQMNIYEGICYAFFSILAALIVGLPIAVVACREVSKAAFAGKIIPYQFPILEMGLFVLVLFGLEVILSVWTIRRQTKQSLIEQMRATE